MYKNKFRAIFFPFMLGLAVVCGMLINSLLNKRSSLPYRTATGAVTMQGSKLDLIMNMIHYSYVDSVNIKKIEENVIPLLLKDLDPHTVYIPAKDMQRVNEEMIGNFGGIGVQFYKYQDTIVVIKVIDNGPSAKAGVLSGDRIVKVNDSVVAGRNMATEPIMSMMRGEIGSEVYLTLVRRSQKDPIVKKITRGSIPIKSVDVAYMLNDTTGLIKVRTFGLHTYDEFMRAMDKLTAQGMKKVIIDLRQNEGGILPIAIKMLNEFLPEGRLILYTQGKAVPRMDYNSNGQGKYQQLPITVVIDEYSASASEIFAGAIQDNDRGTIIGRRSYGKGLVQEQRPLSDGSAIRLTVARYYIPSGRCIQKPYDQGKEKYYQDIVARLRHGELGQKDSIHFDENLKFKTLGGRTVYGGGGVMPDIFVPIDTSGFSEYLVKINNPNSPLLYEYTFEFMDQHRDHLKGITDYKQLLNYLQSIDLVEEMVHYAAKRGVKQDAKGIKKSYPSILHNIKSYIGRHVLDDEGFYPIFFMNDKTIQAAVNE